MYQQQPLTNFLIVAGVILLGIPAGLWLFEALGDKQATASQTMRRGPQATAVYDKCMTLAATQLNKSSVQHAYCNCYVEEAERRLEPNDYPFVVAALSGDVRRVEREVKSLSRNEQIASTKRIKQFKDTALRRCTKVGIEAAEAARKAS